MAVVTSDLLSATLTGAKAIFNEAFPAAFNAQTWTKLVLDGRAQDAKGRETMQYGWLGQVPKMQRWTGNLELSGLEAYDYSITNYLHVAAFEVERLAFERDNLGMIPPRTRQLADEAARYPGETIFDLVNAGASGTAFDGTAFFSNGRVIGSSGTIDNILAQTGTTAANVRTDIGLAIAQMAAYKDDRGRPLNKIPNVILIHPNMLAAVYEALNIGAGSDEAAVPPAMGDGVLLWQAKGYTVIVSAYLTDTTGLYFFHVSPGLAPFIYQEEIAPQLEGITTPNSESGVVLERFVYKVRGSFGTGYGDPRLAIIVT